MDQRPLVDVDLREALAPINRNQAGQGGLFVPAIRTAAQLRDRAACGLLDLKLSHACYVGGALVGTCLVERDGDSALLDAIGIEPLALQRGAGQALLESVCAAATAAGVKRLATYASDLDSTLQGILQAVEFSRRRTVARYTLTGAPAALPQPLDLGSEPQPTAASEPFARVIDLGTALPLLQAGSQPPLLFGQRPGVLTKLAAKLTVYGLFDSAANAPKGVAVCEGERKLLVGLGGETLALGPLLCLLAARHGIACMDAIVDGDAAESALLAAGFQRVALRAEWVKDLG